MSKEHKQKGGYKGGLKSMLSGNILILNSLFLKMVRPRRLELPLRLKNSDLNAARLPIPPRPHTVFPVFILCY